MREKKEEMRFDYLLGRKHSCQVGVVPMEMCEGFLIKIIC